MANRKSIYKGPTTKVPLQKSLLVYQLEGTITYYIDNNPEWDQYVQRMSTDATYAEQPQLWAIAVIYQIRIHIYSIYEYPTIVPIGYDYKHTIYLQYEPESQHYSSLIPHKLQEEPIPQEQAMILPMKQIQQTIGFPSHVSAVNHLQSQSLHPHQWINPQLSYNY